MKKAGTEAPTESTEETSAKPAKTSPRKKNVNTKGSSKKATRAQASSNSNQSQQIIDTASYLFRKQGYNKTSLSQIARHIGLDQSSIYYWFPSKEAILERIYDLNRTTPIIDRILNVVDDRAVQLYILIVLDVVRKCKLPFDFMELESLVHEHPEKYEGLLNSYRDFYQALEQTISLGIREGVFNECLVDEQAVTILSINEGLQHHFHAKQREELILTSCNYEVKGHSPDAIGHMAARTIIPGMLKDPREIDEIHNSALKAFYETGL